MVSFTDLRYYSILVTLFLPYFIDHFHKLWRICYSFVFMLIRL